MTSIVEPMVAAISAAIAALVPDWLLHAWDWVSGGGASAAAGDAPGRALGGPVRAGQVYRWMEEGEELFSPRVDGSVISTRELKALRGAPAARPAPSAASSTSTRRRWPTEHDHERRRHRPCPCRAGADPRRFDPPQGALERHREALVQDRLSALPPCDAPPSEHRRLHRPGVQAKLDADPELQAFVLARLDRLTFKNIAAEVAQCFPPERRVRSFRDPRMGLPAARPRPGRPGSFRVARGLPTSSEIPQLVS
ncbi:MAG: hypothetical protein U1E40_05615 [Amaricoccus sp.]